MSKICKNCATENEDKFSYCKNCGTPLDATERTKTQSQYREYSYSNPVPQEIDGISTEEIGEFVGQNKRKIIDKFSKMSITDSRISWCWPAAILGVLFGFFGAAFWLFYRKMYKYGLIALAVAVVSLGINTVITYEPTVALIEHCVNAFYELKGANPDVEGFLALFSKALDAFTATKQIMLVNLLNEITTYSATIIYGLFGMYLYKKYTVEKIRVYRTNNSDSEYYSYGIKAMGGTSIGMAVLCIIITIFIQNFITSLPLFAFILL